MIYVRLKPNWNGTFQRTIRDKDKKVLNVRTFAPGEVVGLPPTEVPGIRRDLGNALQPVEWSEEHGKFRPIDVADLDLDGLIKSIEDGTYEDEPDPPAPENLDRIPPRRRHPSWKLPEQTTGTDPAATGDPGKPTDQKLATSPTGDQTKGPVTNGANAS